MALEDHESIRKEISELREEVRLGFQKMQEWRDKTDGAMKGDKDHGIWGYRQKIDYNRDGIKENRDEIASVKATVQQIIWMSVGAGSVSGIAASIIFMLLQTLWV